MRFRNDHPTYVIYLGLVNMLRGAEFCGANLSPETNGRAVICDISTAVLHLITIQAPGSRRALRTLKISLRAARAWLGMRQFSDSSERNRESAQETPGREAGAPPRHVGQPA